MSRYNIEHGLLGMVENSPNRLAAVSLYRSASAAEFQASEIKVLELLSPHIRRTSNSTSKTCSLTCRNRSAPSF
jgi:hypothetical protein